MKLCSDTNLSLSLTLYALITAISLSSCCRSHPNSPCSSQDGGARVKAPVEPQRELLKVSGNEHLDGLHPELVRRARLLYERAADRGVKLRFISGYRRYRKRRARPGKSVASWHNFGAAFDLILRDRRTMRDALKHIKRDRKRWDQVGAIARELGLTWGKSWGGDKEIFHFEWHPGHPDALRRPAFKRLTAVTGPDVKNYRAAWRLFKR